MIEYRGSLTEADYVEVARLFREMLPAAGGGDSPALFGLGFSVLAFWGYFGGPEPSPDSLWWLAFAVPSFVWWWARRPNPRKDWRTTPALREEYQGRITEQALETRLGTEARVPWQLFSAHAASARVVVLFMGSRFVPLARGFFRSDAEWQAAAATIREKVAAGQAKGATWLRTVLWILLLLVIFFAWHFAQIPSSQRRPRTEMQRTLPG